MKKTLTFTYDSKYKTLLLHTFDSVIIFSTLRHLMLHLNKLSEKVNETGMTAKNLSIVWAPKLLRTPLSIHTGCETGFGGVSIKLTGKNSCSNGKLVSQKNSSNITNKSVIHQD